MKKKIIIVVLVVVFLLLLGLHSFVFYLHNYTDENVPSDLKERVTTRKVITNNKSSANYTFDKLHIMAPSDLPLIKETETYVEYMLTEEDYSRLKASLTISKVELLDVEDKDDPIRYKFYKHLFKLYDIDDNVDLIKYRLDHYQDKPKFYWSIPHLRMNYIANDYYSIYFDNFDEASFLEGDLKGFLVTIDKESSDLYTLMFVNGDYVYYVRLFLNDEYKYQYDIDSILSSVYFE